MEHSERHRRISIEITTLPVRPLAPHFTPSSRPVMHPVHPSKFRTELYLLTLRLQSCNQLESFLQTCAAENPASREEALESSKVSTCCPGLLPVWRLRRRLSPRHLDGSPG